MKKSIACSLLLASLLVGLSSPADPATQSVTGKDYDFKGIGALHLTFPKDWADKSSRMPKGKERVNVIVFTPFSGSDFQTAVEVRYLGDGAIRDFDIRASLRQAGQMELTNCVETTLDIHDLVGPEATGAYYTVTDKRWVNSQSPEGEFKYLTQGYAKISGMLLNFRVVSNLAPGEEKKQALEMIRTARFRRQ